MARPFPTSWRIRVAGLLLVLSGYCFRESAIEFKVGDYGMGILHISSALMAVALLVRVAGPRIGMCLPGGTFMAEICQGVTGIGLMEGVSMMNLGVMALLGSKGAWHAVGIW